MNIYRWSSFQLARSYKYFRQVFEALRKTAPKIVHYKARPPHTAILDSLGPPARPHHPCNPWICNWRRGRRRGWLRDRRFWESKYRDQWLPPSYPKLSRSCAGHLRTVPNGSETPPNGSERFRGPVCRFTRGLRAGSGPLGPLGVCCRGTGFRSPKFGWWVTDWCNQFTTSNFLTNSPKLSEFAKKWCYCEETLCLLFSCTFDVWPSICCISCFLLQRLTFIT